MKVNLADLSVMRASAFSLCKVKATEPLGKRLLQIVQRLEQAEQAARQRQQDRAATIGQRQRERLFTLTWPGGRTEQIAGWHALALRLELSQSSLPVMFSRGAGTLQRMLPDADGNDCAVTITRHDYKRVTKGKLA